MAAAQEGRRLRRRRRGDRAVSRVGALGPHRGGGPARAARGWPRCARRWTRSGAPRRRRWTPRTQPVMLASPGEQRLLRARLALRDQVRRRARARRARRRVGRALRTGGPGLHRPLPRGRHRAAGAAGRRASCSTARSSRSTRAAGRSFQRLQNRMHLTAPTDVERARGTVPVSAVFFDALALEGRDLRTLPLAERKALLALTVPAARRHPLRRPRGRAGRGLLRGGGRAAAGGHRRQARREPLHGRPLARAGSRSSATCARSSSSAAGPTRRARAAGSARCTWASTTGDRLVYVGKVGTGIRRGDAAAGVGPPAAAEARDIAVRRRHTDGPRPSLGRADAGGRGALHRVDRGRRHSPSRRSSGCGWTSRRGTAAGRRAVLAPNASARSRRRLAEREARVPVASARHGAREDEGAARGAVGPADRHVVVTNPTKVFWPEERLHEVGSRRLLRERRAVAPALSAGRARWC